MKFLIIPLVFLLSSAGAYDYIVELNAEPENFNFMTFQSQGLKLQTAYLLQNAKQPNGKTVLLMHGKNFSVVYWTETMHFLATKGYNVIAVDQVGFGRSSQPLSYQYSFQQLAKNTKLLLDSLHIKEVIIIGHSMGGMLASRFALMYPKTCTKLILENPLGLEDWKLSIPYLTVENQTKEELTKTRPELKAYMLKNYFHNEWKPAYEMLLDENERLLKDEQFNVYARNMALTSDMIFTQPVCYEFKDLTMPVSLIIGQEDKTAIGKDRFNSSVAKNLGNYVDLGKKAAAEIKSATLLELPGIGHIPHIENFKLFSEALDKSL